jgi:VIT1/CCC1 family predicted Fe2+/Mn2+ transporter
MFILEIANLISRENAKRNADTEDDEMAQKYSHQLITGISFGITSGTITALGMLVGLESATSDPKVVVAGLVVMAVADGLADACGLHVAEESETDGGGGSKHTHKEVWLTTVITFLSVCGFILTFAIPVLLFQLETAVPLAIAWGMLLLIVFNLYVAKIKNERPIKIILEHILIATVVIVISYWIGDLIATLAI